MALAEGLKVPGAHGMGDEEQKEPAGAAWQACAFAVVRDDAESRNAAMKRVDAMLFIARGGLQPTR